MRLAISALAHGVKRLACAVSVVVALALFRVTAAAPLVPHVDMRERWSFLLVPVGPDGCPTERADAGFAELRASCAKGETQAKQAKSRKEKAALYATWKEYCVDKYSELYASALARKYSHADFAEAFRQSRGDATRFECLLVASHNAAVQAEVAAKQAEWDAAERATEAQSERIEAARAALEAAPSPEPELSGWQKTRRSLGLFLQGMGQGLAGVAHGAPAPSPGGCKSDYECPFGSACVKDEFRSTGSCAQNVNASGVPKFSPPDLSSVQLGGPGQCMIDTECPVGFRCEKQPGALRGACLAR